MNIKTLAFETNPVNQGMCINSFDDYGVKTGTKEGNFTQIIEERLRARAGNPVINPVSIKGSFDTGKQKTTFGSGISEEEVLKIIREFNK